MRRDCVTTGIAKIILATLTAMLLLLPLACGTSSTTSAPVEDGDFDSSPDGDDAEEERGETVDRDSLDQFETEMAEAEAEAESVWPDGDADSEDDPCVLLPPARLSFDKDGQILTPRSLITLDAVQPFSPVEVLSESYRYEWVKSPEMAPKLRLVCKGCDTRRDQDLIGREVSETNPQLFLPVAGVYQLRLTLTRTIVTPGNTGYICVSHKETVALARYDDEVAVELAWDADTHPTADLDLMMVRLRRGGSFGVSRAIDDLVVPPYVSLPSCTKDADCLAGLFSCDTQAGHCRNICVDDLPCLALNPGFLCEKGACAAQPVTACPSDAACSLGQTCSSVPRDGSWQALCTHHNDIQRQDTCFSANPVAFWGGYTATTTSCQGTRDCLDFYDEAARCVLDPNNSGTCTLPKPESGPILITNRQEDPGLEIIRVPVLKETYSRIVVWTKAGTSPSSAPLRARLQVYVNGKASYTTPISNSVPVQLDTFWKALTLGAGNPARSGVICAGDTGYPCDSDAACRTALLDNNFVCNEGFCTCPGSNPLGLFKQDPYANPFRFERSEAPLPFDTTETQGRDIFCDGPTSLSSELRPVYCDDHYRGN